MSGRQTKRSHAGQKKDEQKKDYKVVYELGTHEKKKLDVAVDYSATAPSGYTYVPFGWPELVERCKELSRKKGLKVYVVSPGPINGAHRDPAKISHHIHREGYHFANDVVEQACRYYDFRRRPTEAGDGGRAASNTRADGVAGTSALAKRLERTGERLGVGGKNTSSEAQLRKVSETIRELFPRFPEDELSQVVGRAFEEGKNRVGTASDLSLARRVQLAVVAHARHVHTHYDFLLKELSWVEARQKVEKPCLDQIKLWRGEDQSDDVELEEIFREIIIIDDDDGPDEDNPTQMDHSANGPKPKRRALESTRTNGNYARSPSIEYVSSQRAVQEPMAANVRSADNIEVVSVSPRRALKTQHFVEAQALPYHHRPRVVTDDERLATVPSSRGLRVLPNGVRSVAPEQLHQNQDSLFSRVGQWDAPMLHKPTVKVGTARHDQSVMQSIEKSPHLSQSFERKNLAYPSASEVPQGLMHEQYDFRAKPDYIRSFAPIATYHDASRSRLGRGRSASPPRMAELPIRLARNRTDLGTHHLTRQDFGVARAPPPIPSDPLGLRQALQPRMFYDSPHVPRTQPNPSMSQGVFLGAPQQWHQDGSRPVAYPTQLAYTRPEEPARVSVMSVATHALYDPQRPEIPGLERPRPYAPFA